MGRKRSQALASKDDASLEQILKDVEGLSPEGQSLYADILKELSAGDDTTFKTLIDADYSFPPPSIEEFINDPYYLGSACSPEQVEGEDFIGLFPKWREYLLRDLDDASEARQFLLSGAIGLGKSFVASVILLHLLAQVLCLRDPLKHFGLIGTTGIIFSFFSVTQSQVASGTFLDCLNLLRCSPFFRERSKVDLDKKFSNLRIDFEKNVAIEAGSRVHEALGRNVIMSVIDEINFRLEKDAAKAAHELVEAIHRRMKSRFRRASSNPGRLIIISSARNDGDYLAAYIRKYKDDPDVRVYDNPWWEVVGVTRMKYCGKTFTMDVGDALNTPRIIDNDLEAAKIPPTRLIRPPVEHRRDFERDPVGAIRDIAGVATGRSTKLFPQITDLYNCLSDDLSPAMTSHDVPLSVIGTNEINESLTSETLTTIRYGKISPKRHPAAPRYIHMDMSSGAIDAMGFVMVHPSGNKGVAVADHITGTIADKMMPCYEVDLAFRIVRSVGGNELDFGRIRKFIWWLRNIGFNIQMITCDLAHLSTEMRTILTKGGFNTGYLSVDRKKDPYITLKHVVIEQRLSMSDNDYLLTELTNLEDGVDKIDHPSKFPPCVIDKTYYPELAGSKDLGDGLAGAIFAAETSGKEVFTMDPDDRMAMMRSAVGKRDSILEAQNVTFPTF